MEKIKLDPKLLKPLTEIMAQIPEGERIDFIDKFVKDVEETMKKAKKYASSHNTTFNEALKVILEQRKQKVITEE